MKEKIFDQMIEKAATRFEAWVEPPAEAPDRELTSSRKEHALFRFAAKGIVVAVEHGLIFASYSLAMRERKAGTLLCVRLGAAGLATERITTLFFKRKWE